MSVKWLMMGASSKYREEVFFLLIYSKNIFFLYSVKYHILSCAVLEFSLIFVALFVHYLYLCKISQVICENIYGVNTCWSRLLQSCYYLFTLKAQHRNPFHINSCLSCMKTCVIGTALEACLLKVFWRIDLEKNCLSWCKVKRCWVLLFQLFHRILTTMLYFSGLSCCDDCFWLVSKC